MILLIYSEAIMAFGKKMLNKQKGYAICNDTKCMNENLQTCSKAYWYDSGGNSWLEMFVQGYDGDDCVLVTKRSNKEKTICRFGKDIFSEDLVDEVFGVHKGLREVIDANCQTTK